MRQTLAQMGILKKDKEHNAQEVCQLKITFEELRNQLEWLSSPHPQAGPTEAEQ
jgi:hypothetical protein